jgi:tripartite-type tricarboxylate transporter receptor subunit TctC
MGIGARLACSLALIAILGADATALGAQEASYPSRPIKLVIGFPAGGLIDIIARVVSDKLAVMLGQPFIIEPKPGATGTIATASVAKADPDGYTLLMVNDNHALNPSLVKNVPYDSLKDFATIGLVGRIPMIFTASPQFPHSTVKSVIDAAREKPGTITFASIGIGSGSHLAAEQLASLAHVKFQHVPYRGGQLAVNDLLAGHVDTMVLSTFVGLELIKAGKLMPLAAATEKRLDVLPNLPTLAETGFPVEAYSWVGLVAPAGTPEPILAKLEKALAEVLAMPDVQKRLVEMGGTVEPYGRKQFEEYIRSEIVRWKGVADKLGLEAK